MSSRAKREKVEVTLNRDRLNQAIAADAETVIGEFDVALRNEGEPVHVHLRFGGPLARAVSVGTSNHFVDGGTTHLVEVSVAPIESPLEGTLEVVTGHGADGTALRLTVEPPSPPVQVDESLGRPPGARGGPPPRAGPPGSDDLTGVDPGETASESADAEPSEEQDGDPADGDPADASGGTRLRDRTSRDRTGSEGLTRTFSNVADDGSPDAATLAVGVFALAALVGAVGLGVVFDSAAVSVGVVAVAVSVGAALYLLASE